MAVALLVAAVATVTPAHCRKTFNASMIKRAVDAEYHGARDVSDQDRKDVRRFIRCARPSVSKRAMHRYNWRAFKAWRQRRLDALMEPAIASWYGLHGIGACGVDDVQNGYRFASLFLSCGSWIHICHRGRCEDAEMVDHGPYVYGRTFDLNANLRAALGCGGICHVRWRHL